MSNDGTLEQAIDGIVRQMNLDPGEALGARVKLAICELYERTPVGWAGAIAVLMKHAEDCPDNGAVELLECACEPAIEIVCLEEGQETLH